MKDQNNFTDKLNSINCWYNSLMCAKNLYLIHNSHSLFCSKMYIRLLVWCHCHPIWPPELSLNLINILTVPLKLSLGRLPFKIYVPHSKSHILIFHSLGNLPKESVQAQGSLKSFITGSFFYGQGLWAPRQIPKLEDHPLSTVCGCLFNLFAATFHSWSPSPPSVIWRHIMPWWQGTHVTWSLRMYIFFS
jgi:hypothetical protein